jgi:hypothetical protein
MAQAPPDLVAHDRIADDTSDDETHEGLGIDLISAEEVDDEVRPSGTTSTPDGRGELGPPPHPECLRQHGEKSIRR